MKKKWNIRGFLCVLVSLVSIFLATGCNMGNPKSKWYKKTFVSIGDSITYQDGRNYTRGEVDVTARGYQTLLCEKLGFSSYHNAGMDGRPMSNGSANGEGNVSLALEFDFSGYDLCIIAAGTNDFKLNMPIGEYKTDKTAYDITTFYGAYQTTLDCIKKSNEKITVCLFTPLQRNNAGYTTTSTNTAGHKLIDYVNAVKDLGEKYSVSVCDMYANSGITEENVFEYTIDGLHPNNKGYELMGACAVEFISKLQ